MLPNTFNQSLGSVRSSRFDVFRVFNIEPRTCLTILISLLVIFSFNPWWLRSSARAEASSESESKRLDRPADPSIPEYKPRKDSIPRARIGGRIRGEGENPEVAALVPDHVAFSSKQKPSLYWYLSKPTSLPIRFTLNDTRVVRPVIDTPVPAPAEPGIQRIRLQDYGFALEADVQYMWAISVIQNPESPSQDIASGGIIEAVVYAEACMLGPCICKREDVYRYAKEGFWYDAIACISELLESSPKDRKLRVLRASLLEQVGLHDVAKWDLGQDRSP